VKAWVLCFLAVVVTFPSLGQSPAPVRPTPVIIPLATNLPPRTELMSQSARCRDILRANIFDFYIKCLDQTNGGYLEAMQTNTFIATGEKFLTLQARQLWFFSTIVNEGHDTNAAMQAARHGYVFLTQRFHDAKNGGFYSKVNDQGSPTDPRKHAYLNAFAIYGLSAYYRASKDRTALQAAQAAFTTLDRRAYDPVNGGYYEMFTEDWKPILDPKEPGYVGRNGHKTYNTHLHLMEAFAELYRIWPDETLRRRLTELVHINANTVRFPGADCNVDAFWPNWRYVEEPRNLRASYGHDIECAWLVIDAARTLGMSPYLFRPWAETLCRYSLEFGYDKEYGGFYNGGPIGKAADDLKKTWWVQAEALPAMLEMYRTTGDIRYYEAFKQTLDFVEEHQMAPQGSWWAERERDGTASQNASRTSMWQGAYHSGRAMMVCIRWLDALAARMPR